MDDSVNNSKTDPRTSGTKIVKVNGYLAKVPKNFIISKDQPVVLLYDLKNDRLPGEALYIGPLCNCTKCQISISKHGRSLDAEMIIAAIEQNSSPVFKPRDVVQTREIVAPLVTSTPNSSKSLNNNEITLQTANRNVDAIGIIETSGIPILDSDSGWDNRQDFLLKVNRGLEKQVEVELADEERFVKPSDKERNSIVPLRHKDSENGRNVGKTEQVVPKIESQNRIFKSSKDFVSPNQIEVPKRVSRKNIPFKDAGRRSRCSEGKRKQPDPPGDISASCKVPRVESIKKEQKKRQAKRDQKH